MTFNTNIPHSGAAACNATHNVFCVDTILGGAALYKMDDGTRLKDLEIPRKKELAAPKQVALAEDCTVIVGGSDHGIVYVFDRKTGAMIQKLRTRKDTWVQAITVSLVSLFGIAIPNVPRPPLSTVYQQS